LTHQLRIVDPVCLLKLCLCAPLVAHVKVEKALKDDDRMLSYRTAEMSCRRGTHRDISGFPGGDVPIT
jgi:hypothetical protein